MGFVQAAYAVAHTKRNHLSAQSHRLVGRRGKKEAVIAVAHSILVIAYHMLKRHQPSQDLGGNSFDELKPETTAQRLAKRIEKLGYMVVLQAPSVIAMPSPRTFSS
jgi:transposase